MCTFNNSILLLLWSLQERIFSFSQFPLRTRAHKRSLFLFRIVNFLFSIFAFPNFSSFSSVHEASKHVCFTRHISSWLLFPCFLHRPFELSLHIWILSFSLFSMPTGRGNRVYIVHLASWQSQQRRNHNENSFLFTVKSASSWTIQSHIAFQVAKNLSISSS